MLTWLKNRVLGPTRRIAAAAMPRFLRARVDSAMYGLDSKHWSMADHLSADSAYSHSVRKIVRSRARYEVLNNCYAKGITQTHTTNIIGSGPRLQVVTPDEGLNETVERQWKLWATENKLIDKLRVLVQAKTVDGESFAMLTTGSNPCGVSLDVRPVEADQFTTPNLAVWKPGFVDGIEFNEESGRPYAYHVLKRHPGDIIAGPTLDYDRVWAHHVIHLYRMDRPGQHRGLSEISPALPLFGYLRRYTLATVGSAEHAAAYSFFMKTNSAALAADVPEWDEVDYHHGAGVFLPEGWEPFQLKAEHPAAPYDMFVTRLLREIARVLDMPFNIAACDSAGYNYSSGRLDHQIYGKRILADQEYVERECLDRIFAAWLNEAVLAGVLPIAAVQAEYAHAWYWDPFTDIDPEKTKKTHALALASGLTSFPTVYAEQGQDWRTEFTNQAAALGMTLDAFKEALRNKLLGTTSGAQVAAASKVEAAEASEAEEERTPTGELGGISRLQWKRNMKAIRDVLDDVRHDGMSTVMAMEMLQSLGLPFERAEALVTDAVAQRAEDPEFAGADA